MSEQSPPSEDVAVDKRSADIGIVCSTTLEIRPLLKKLDRVRRYVDDGATFRGGFLEESLRIAVVEAGFGFARHRRVTEVLVQEHRPAWILSVGFSSPLSEDLQPGDVSLASEIVDTHGNGLPVKCPIPEGKRILVRRHVVADHHPGKAADRLALAQQFEASALDTCSLAVAQACEPTGDDESRVSRFLSVRGIVGSFDQDLPDKAMALLFQENENSKTTGLGGIWQKLKPDPELAPWKKAAEITAVNLNRFTLSVIERLADKIRT